MAVSIDWTTRIISVPQIDLTPLGGLIYELDINAFRLVLKNLEDSSDGMSFPDTHQHNTTVTVGGVVLSRVVEIINGYTVTFEDVGSPYAVNLVGANSNIADITNINNVSVRSSNSAGLIQGGSVDQQSIRDAMALSTLLTPQPGSIDDILLSTPADVVSAFNSETYDGISFATIVGDLLSMANGKIVESPANTFTFYSPDNTTPRYVLKKINNERQRIS